MKKNDQPEKIKGWSIFYDEKKNDKPREYLVRAVDYVENKKNALDLGAGVLRDTQYLLDIGFEKVTAVDANIAIQEIGDNIDDQRLQTIISKFEDFEFLDSSYDLINAQYSLPFMKQEYFIEVMEKIKKSLKPGGVFAATFLGDRDDWNTKEHKVDSFQTKLEIKHIFEDFEIIELLEKEEDRPVVGRKGLKHWHTFHVTSRKM